MQITIIGAGNVGAALTDAASRAGHSVTVTSRSGESARRLAEATGARPAASAREAVEGADLVVLAVPWDGVHDVLNDAGDALAGKILVDATNPLTPDYSDLAITESSGAEEIQRAAPLARVVKAFNTQLAARQADPTVSGLRVDGYVAADDPEAKATVLTLLGELGFNPIDVGGLAMAKHLEALAFLNIALQMRHGWSWQAGWKLIGPDGDAT